MTGAAHDLTRAEAPWTESEVANLAAWQSCGWVHPYTCLNHHTLTPTVHGWVCGACDYTQRWCWRPMLGGPPPEPKL